MRRDVAFVTIRPQNPTEYEGGRAPKQVWRWRLREN